VNSITRPQGFQKIFIIDFEKLKGTLARKSVSNKHIGGAPPYAFNMNRNYNLKKFLIVRLTTTILAASFHRCKNLFTCGPGPQINLIPGAWLNFLIDMR
jgi:hypothetical protein